MVRVQRPDFPPHRCAFTLRDTDPEGFFTGQVMSGWDPTAYVSASAVKSMARELGFVDGDTHQHVLEELEQAREEAQRLQEELAELQRSFDAIDMLASKGFVARKKPGRPKENVT